MPRFCSLAFLVLLSTALMGSDCGEPEGVSLSELRRDVAPPFDYDLYCDSHGTLVGERSAVLLVYRSAHLEKVYADAQAGDERARVLFGQLEDTLHRAGDQLADKAQGMVCHSAPACTVQWHFLDEMMPSRQAGGLRLRSLLAASFERRAKLKGVENAVLVGALDVLLAGSLLKSAATGTAEGRGVTAEARGGSALSGLKGRLTVEESAALEVRLAEAEALEAGARHSARVETLTNHRPSVKQPPPGVAADSPRWTAYVAYWERRYEELAGTRPVPAGRMEIKPPLTWERYAGFLDRFQKALEFQRGVARALQQEARGTGQERAWLRGLEQPLVAENVGLAREGRASLTFVDQLVVDEATIRLGRQPSIHSFSNKQHDFSRMNLEDARGQLRVDVNEAFAKYGGTIEVRRSGHPLFGRTVAVSRVHLVYDGTGLAPDFKKALSHDAYRRGVELHFHVP
jgi:hypothetical protein